MRKDWIASTSHLYGIPACRNKHTQELAIASKRGELWVYNDELAGCLVRSGKVVRKVRELLFEGTLERLYKGDEYQFRIPNALVPEVVKLLGIKRRFSTQLSALNGDGL